MEVSCRKTESLFEFWNSIEFLAQQGGVFIEQGKATIKITGWLQI